MSSIYEVIQLKVIVIGLGSMGKRRIRNLLELGFQPEAIVGFDMKLDRVLEAKEKYGISFVEKLSSNELDGFDAAFICVPPDQHTFYAHMAVDKNIHCFIEASVVDEQLSELNEKIKNTSIKVYASCTLRFHPTVIKIKELIDSKELGKVTNFSYHSGQYLPDWHPWESIEDFYVSKKSTGGGREIVPFELSWLNWVLGPIETVMGWNGKTMDLGVDIDDTYASVLKYKNGAVGTLIVDVVSRSAVRMLTLNCEEGQIYWNWNLRELQVYRATTGQWEIIPDEGGIAEPGYNPNIIEKMYIDEVNTFLNSIKTNQPVANSIEEDLYTLSCLYAIEQSSKSSKVTLM